jgi:hypothetical protein
MKPHGSPFRPWVAQYSATFDWYSGSSSARLGIGVYRLAQIQEQLNMMEAPLLWWFQLTNSTITDGQVNGNLERVTSRYLIYALVDPRTGQWRYVGGV